MPKAPRKVPVPPPHPQRPWLIEATVAGQVLTVRFAEGPEAASAFAKLASRARRGHLDRVMLWSGSACIDVALPGSGGLGRMARTEGLELIAPDGRVVQLVSHPPAPGSSAISDLARVCHCGQLVHEFMEKCPGCPGPQGAGKVLRAPRRQSTVIASPEDLGL
jgi:hypothetical protein